MIFKIEEMYTYRRLFRIGKSTEMINNIIQYR
jgi:hypothetical protein